MSNQVAAKRAGYALHVLTASGAVAGMLALQAVIDGHWRMALIWLIVCQILDGLDGPIARRLEVTIHAPRIDGHILDLIVDYITCVLVPMALLVRLDLLPHHYQTLVAGFIILFSAIWFARTDLETDDHWFNGFPAVWNLVVPTLLICNSGRTTVLIVSLILCISQLTNFKIPHLVRVKYQRHFTLPLAIIYLADLTILSWRYNDVTGVNASRLETAILIIFPIYILFISIWRTWFADKKIPLLGRIAN